MNLLTFNTKQGAETRNKAEAKRLGRKVDDPDNITKFEWTMHRSETLNEYGLEIPDKRKLKRNERLKLKTIAMNNKDWFPDFVGEPKKKTLLQKIVQFFTGS